MCPKVLGLDDASVAARSSRARHSRACGAGPRASRRRPDCARWFSHTEAPLHGPDARCHAPRAGPPSWRGERQIGLPNEVDRRIWRERRQIGLAHAVDRRIWRERRQIGLVHAVDRRIWREKRRRGTTQNRRCRTGDTATRVVIRSNPTAPTRSVGPRVPSRPLLERTNVGCAHKECGTCERPGGAICSRSDQEVVEAITVHITRSRNAVPAPWPAASPMSSASASPRLRSPSTGPNSRYAVTRHQPTHAVPVRPVQKVIEPGSTGAAPKPPRTLQGCRSLR